MITGNLIMVPLNLREKKNQETIQNIIRDKSQVTLFNTSDTESVCYNMQY